jgi:predicted ATPase
MTALTATGRRADALRVYDDFRRLLGDELGIEPSPLLAAQHTALLESEPPAHPGTATWRPPGRLPVPAASLIGRGPLVEEVLATVQDHRVVTLVGPGGVGKTRLLVELGHRLRAERENRPVVMGELAPAVDESALDVVAAALGIDARPGVAAVDRVTAVLGDTEAVMLLDNCEQVLEPVAALVDGLVARCPRVTVVATSRERLRVQGERVCVVPPLDARGSDSTAVQLFLERARAVTPDMEPTGGDLDVIADIVGRLDGLPLAIELAAARLHTHDVTEVAAGLDHRFSLLSSGFRTSARHGSLRAAVSWSFDLLDRALQRIFADVSVFAGPFTADDAAAVCDLDRAAAVTALGQLCERSLVMRAPNRRYVLLETLREFGIEQLRATGRVASACERHARHQVDWIERANRRLPEPGQPVLSEIDEAVPELRSALVWGLDHGDVHLAARLVVALLDYGIMRLRPDVLAWSEDVTAADLDDRDPLAASVWVVAAYAAWMAGDVDEMRTRGTRALRAGEQAGDVPPEAVLNWANSALFEGRLDEASARYRRAVEAASGDRVRELMARGTQLLALGYAGEATVDDMAEALLAEVGEAVTPHCAYVWYCAGEAVLSDDVERARARYTRALELAARTNTSFVTGLAGASKASIDARLGDPEEAAQDYRRLIMHWRRAGMWSTQWTMLRSIAGLLARLGRPHDAAVLVGALRATQAGHRIFGTDEVALTELDAELRETLGVEAHEAARRDGAALDGDAAVEHALRAL